MTNGEKIKEIFPDIQIFNIVENEQQEKFIHIRLKDVCQAIELEWWNAEYQEPTTKNDLGDEYISRSELMAILSDYYDTTVEYRSMLKEIAALSSATPQEPKTGHCKDCKWWKDSDGAYRRGVGAESQCPINRREVFEGNGYCYIFDPQESEDKE